MLKLIKKIFAFVDDRKKVLDPIVAVLLAFVPFLQHYIGIVDNAGSTLMALLVPYLGLRVLPTLRTLKLRSFALISGLILFFLYKLVDHGTYFVEIAQVGLMIFYIVCAMQHCIDTKMLKKAAICIAALAGLLLIAQYFCYFVLGFHLQLVPTPLLLEESEQWILLAQTGTHSITGVQGDLYRPSAFFLEPSHLFMYGFPCLFISLFAHENRKHNRIAALLITVGLVLSTSGMGILVAAGAWGLYQGLRNKEGNDFRLKYIPCKEMVFRVCALLALYAVLFMTVPFINEGISRIFISEAGTSTAIDGRTELAIRTLRKIESTSVIQKLFGSSDTLEGITHNMPGYMATVYKYGFIGIILSYSFYAIGLFKLNMAYFWLSAILILTSFFSAHTHGTFFMLFYVLLLVEGHRSSGESWLLAELKFLFNTLFKKRTTK
ncbi:MAG: hypothetical protein IKW00_06840 [Clostridia bacterium]|nr:hypothetical protein [Clostridia bacterium]